MKRYISERRTIALVKKARIGGARRAHILIAKAAVIINIGSKRKIDFSGEINGPETPVPKGPENGKLEETEGCKSLNCSANIAM